MPYYRLQSAEEELKEVEGGVTEEAASYSHDRSSLTALQKTIEKIEVHTFTNFSRSIILKPHILVLKSAATVTVSPLKF